MEDLATAEWIRARLENDTGSGGLFDPARPNNQHLSGAYLDIIPEDKDLPAIRYHVQNADDVRQAMGGPHRIMVKIDWLVVIVNEGLSIAPLVPLAARLDSLLHEANGETSDVRVMQSVRLSPFTMTEPDASGLSYRHVGGMYRTHVQAK